MSKKLYLECNSGISGDMFTAALIDLGADKEVLMRALNSLPVKGFDVKISRVKKSGLDTCDFNVVLDKEHENHDHDMAYLYGKEHHDHSHENSDHKHEHNHEHDHVHEHDHDHHHEAHHRHSHEHRGLPEIMDIINHGDLTEHAKALAVKIFEILAGAESKAHGVPKDQVHFHEVGAVDSIVDIVAAAVCLDNLGITETIIPRLNEGMGTVRCQHGILPVPVPAVANIVAENGLTLHIMDRQGEFVTPTGAAIAAAIRTSSVLPENFTMTRIGLGAGKRNYDIPSIVRAMLIEDNEDTPKDMMYKLESNIDDCTGEMLGYVMERLFEAGARDVHYIPVFMKKNRPAYELHVLCDDKNVALMEQIIFSETTTIGIRRIPVERTVLRRRIENVNTPYGIAKVKVCDVPGDQKQSFTRCYPEYESVAALSREHHVPYQEMYRIIVSACKELEQ